MYSGTDGRNYYYTKTQTHTDANERTRMHCIVTPIFPRTDKVAAGGREDTKLNARGRKVQKGKEKQGAERAAE
jgi:hypothetical protein